MAEVALSVATSPLALLGRTSGLSLLAQARALTASVLNRGLGPAAGFEGRLFATVIEAAAPNVGARTRQQAQQTATGLVGLLRATSATQTAGARLQDALAGMLLGPEAPAVERALFSMTTAGTEDGSPQVNAGRAFAGEVRHEADRGISAFSLVVGQQRFELSVTLQPQDTNRDVLGKIADAVNGAGAAVKATVQEARTDGVAAVRLLITADRPDTVNAFSLLDSVGNAIAYSGADRVVAQAGAGQTGGTAGQALGEIDVPGALSAEGRREAISLAREVGAAFGEVVTQAAGMSVRPEIVAVLAAAAQVVAAPLASAGVSATAQGQLQVDEAQLDRTLASADTAPATVSALSAFAVGLGAAARALTEQPVSALLEPATLAELMAEAGPLVPTPTAPVSSLLRPYQPVQPQVNLFALAGLLRGGLLVNLVV